MAVASMLVARQVADDAVGAVLGPGKDQHPREGGVAQHRGASRSRLRSLGTKTTRCSTRSTVVAAGVIDDLHRIGEVVFGQESGDGFWHRRGRTAGSAAAAAAASRCVAVHGRSRDRSMRSASSAPRTWTLASVSQRLSIQVEQAPRRGDEDVNAARHLLSLASDRNAAEHYFGR